MSADDRLAPGALRPARDLLDAHPDVTFVYGFPLWFWQDRPVRQARTTVRGWSVWPGLWWLERRLRQGENCITAPEVVVRTSAQKRVGGYDPRLPHAGDMDMWFRLAAEGRVGFIRGVDQAYYRCTGTTCGPAMTHWATCSRSGSCSSSRWSGAQTGCPTSGISRHRVHRKLSREALWFAGRAYDRREVDATPVDELVAFAFDCWPDSSQLLGYRTLQLRRRLGPRTLSGLQPVVVTPFTRRAHGWAQRQSWKYRGF